MLNIKPITCITYDKVRKKFLDSELVTIYDDFNTFSNKMDTKTYLQIYKNTKLRQRNSPLYETISIYLEELRKRLSSCK